VGDDQTRIMLVTGGAGHVGSHLVEVLVEDPRNRVISLDNYFNGRRENHIPGAEYREGHTKDIDRLVPERPDIVFHLGEYARISTSKEDVRDVFDMNIVGTFAVAEFCRLRRVDKLVYAGSSTKFAIEGDGRHQSPYAFTKATNVDLIRNYGRWFGLPFAICYFYNAFGPREVGTGRYATLIAKFAELKRQGKPLPVVKPGTQLRAFTYVKDLARGIALVGEHGLGDGFSLANQQKFSVLDIANAFGGTIEMVDGDGGRMDAENDAAQATALGWTTTLSVTDYIRELRSGE
jgi:UDP-glucose 4-epimerase